MEILEYDLAYRLLNSANLTIEQKQLVKAKISKMDYQIMKVQIERVFTITSTNVHNKTEVDKIDVKPEENDVFYTSRGKNYRQQNSYTESFNKNNQNF